MSFFKDFKEDLSQAVNELLPEPIVKDVEPEVSLSDVEPAEMAKIENEADEIKGLLSGLDDFGNESETTADDGDIDLKAIEEAILVNDMVTDSQISEPALAEEPIMEMPIEAMEPTIAEELAVETPVETMEPAVEIPVETMEPAVEIPVETMEPAIEMPVEAMEPALIEEPAAEEPVAEELTAFIPDVIEVPEMQMTDNTEKTSEVNNTMSEMILDNEPATDENGVITEGMRINGDVLSNGSLEVLGSIKGNIEIKGKLDISGTVVGNSKAAEVFADGAKITGEVVSLGSVKVGQSSVIVGNISATSAVIAGAVKGDIDVHGPVILDTSAIVMGNIKSKSVQINNGAVIEGHCSQCYAEVSPTSFFNDLK